MINHIILYMLKYFYVNRSIIFIATLGRLSIAVIASSVKSSLFIFWPVSINGSTQLEFIIIIDITSSIFLFTVILISIAVFTFSTRYMSPEKFFLRFKILLLSFVLSMAALILCPNIISILLGWDGLGVTSYLLVVYYNRGKSFNAGIVTAITNRLGDVLIILRAGVLISVGSWNMKLSSWEFYRDSLLQIILVVGCFTKRAQIPFRAWLPAAIAAPTPVSSLVHSSTLVTAGVYVLIRHIEDLLIFFSQDIVLVSGLITMIIARVSALGETDIKKMVALSTLRQLGIMVTRIGIGWMLIAFIHLIIHAFFKAMMFIRTGNCIHISRRYQACSKTGFLSLSSPINRASLVTGGMSLIGAPFAAAFFSKEPILEILLHNDSLVDYTWILIGVTLTLLYRFRFMYFVLSSSTKLERFIILSEEDAYRRGRVIVLFVPSFVRGVVMRNLYLDLSSGKVFIPESWKLSVYTALVFGILIGLAFLRASARKAVLHDLIYIWSLPNFSRRLFNSRSFLTGKISVSSRFGWNVSLIIIARLRGRDNYLIFISENYFLYRMILFIPLRMFLVIVLYI